jgi:phosphatidylserine decarboxylase
MAMKTGGKMEPETQNKFYRADPPSQRAFPVSSAGYSLIYAAGFVTIVLAVLGISPLALAGLLVTLFICFFFRDPDRVTPEKAGAVTSPADGRVVSIARLDTNPFISGNCLKIGIFMSLWDVHVNRIPVSGVIRKISYQPGKFYPANREQASISNERNALVLETDQKQEICFVQIAGIIARRIICRVQEGETVVRGQRFGLICFGSRLDVYLPSNTTIDIRVGDRVESGVSVLGYLPS